MDEFCRAFEWAQRLDLEQPDFSRLPSPLMTGSEKSFSPRLGSRRETGERVLDMNNGAEATASVVQWRGNGGVEVMAGLAVEESVSDECVSPRSIGSEEGGREAEDEEEDVNEDDEDEVEPPDDFYLPTSAMDSQELEQTAEEGFRYECPPTRFDI